MRRGRPPHPELLTPREQEVLVLLREALSNREIGSRLGISRSGAAYHVSEILSKLGVSSREEAAAWPLEAVTAGRWRLAALLPLFGRLRERAAPVVAGQTISALAVMAAIAFLVVLVAGMLVMSSRSEMHETSLPLTSEPALVNAPEGRTGEAELDAIIEALLTQDAAGMLARFGTAEVFAGEMTVNQWASHFSTSERALYAVKHHTPVGGAPPVEIDVIFSLSRPAGSLTSGTPEGWRFGVEGGQVVRMWNGSSPRSFTFDFEDLYDTYIVLPPLDDLPRPPEGYALSTRTGNAEVDRLLALIEANDVDGLIDAVAYRTESCQERLLTVDACQNMIIEEAEVVPAMRATAGGPEFCSGPMSRQDANYVQRWFDAWGESVALHSIATIGRDFEFTTGQDLQADHEIMVVMQLDRYSWQVASLYERDGRIVAMRCRPDPVYPEPREITYFTPPPTDGALPALSRRSGVPMVDAVLDASQSADAEALAALIDYDQVPCVVEPLGIGTPPVCRPGEASGTPVDVFLSAACEGGYVRPDAVTVGADTRAPNALFDSDWRLYALVPADPERSFHRSEMMAVLVTSALDGGLPGGPTSRGAAIGFTAEGLTAVLHGCGPEPPEERVRRLVSPTFLLAPP